LLTLGGRPEGDGPRDRSDGYKRPDAAALHGALASPESIQYLAIGMS